MSVYLQVKVALYTACFERGDLQLLTCGCQRLLGDWGLTQSAGAAVDGACVKIDDAKAWLMSRSTLDSAGTET